MNLFTLLSSMPGCEIMIPSLGSPHFPLFGPSPLRNSPLKWLWILVNWILYILHSRWGLGARAGARRRRDLARERVRERGSQGERRSGAGLGCGARRRSKRSWVNEDRPQCQGHRRVVGLASEPSAGHANDLGFLSLPS